MVTLDEDVRAFVLDQHRLYSALGERVRAIRRALDNGDDLAAVLTTETTMMIESPMTREQMASALASVLGRIAQREDLAEAGRDVVIEAALAGHLAISVPRGGLRWPPVAEPGR